MATRQVECNKCKDAGFASQLISFAKDGTKPDCSIKWKVLNPDGSEHIHRSKPEAATPKAEQGNLAAAINRLTVAIEMLPEARSR